MEPVRKKFKAVLFDLDGTLLDTLRDLADSTNAALRRLGYPTHSVGAYKYFVGDGVSMLIRRALPGDINDDKSVMECLELTQAMYERHWAEKTRPYPRVEIMLDELVKLKIPMSILSNKADVFTVRMVAKLFDEYISCLP